MIFLASEVTSFRDFHLDNLFRFFFDKFFLNKGGRKSGAPKPPKMFDFDLKNDFFAEKQEKNNTTRVPKN